MRLRSVSLAFSLTVGGQAALLRAQVSPSGLPVSGWPSAVAFAGGGVVAWGDPARSVEYPVLSLRQSGTAVVSGFGTGAPGAALRSLRLGAVQVLRNQLSASLALTSREMNDLIDDPSVPDGGLRVSDLELRLGVAKKIKVLRASVGLASEYTRSTIFSTEGTRLAFGMAILVEPTSRAALLVGIEGLGPAVQYRDGLANIRTQSQTRRALVSAGLVLADGDQMAERLYIDYERAMGSESFDRISLSGEITLLKLLTGRAGVTLRHDGRASSEWERLYGLGLALRVSVFEFDYALTTGFNPDDLAPRQHFGLVWRHGREP